MSADTLSASTLVQRKIDGLHRDLEERLSKLRARRDEALNSGYANGPFEAEKLEKEMEALKGVYQGSFDRATVELKNAKDLDAQKQAESMVRQKAMEEASRDAARLAWTRSGGKPEEFETAWPEIRKTQLENLTLRELAKQTDTPRPAIKL